MTGLSGSRILFALNRAHNTISPPILGAVVYSILELIGTRYFFRGDSADIFILGATSFSCNSADRLIIPLTCSREPCWVKIILGVVNSWKFFFGAMIN